MTDGSLQRMIFRALVIATVGALVACSSPKKSPASGTKFSSKWASFESSAKDHNSIVSLPPFERSPRASQDARLVCLTSDSVRSRRAAAGIRSKLLAREPARNLVYRVRPTGTAEEP